MERGEEGREERERREREGEISHTDSEICIL